MTATHTTFLLYAGDTWLIDAALHDSAGKPLNLAGAAIVWRLRLGSSIKVELTVGDGIEVTDEANGIARITLAADRSVALSDGNYNDEVRVTLADGTVCTQAVGNIVVAKPGSPAAPPADDPCTVLATLQAARMALMTGQQIVRFKVENVETQYSTVDLGKLESLISKYDALCGQKHGRPRRFAFRLGPAR